MSAKAGEKPGVKGEPAVRAEQRNAHDAKAAQRRCNDLLTAISAKGFRVDVEKMQLSAMLYTLGRILVLRGVTTEDELEAERLGALGDALAEALQHVEQEALRRPRGPQVEPVRAPGLVIARR